MFLNSIYRKENPFINQISKNLSIILDIHISCENFESIKNTTSFPSFVISTHLPVLPFPRFNQSYLVHFVPLVPFSFRPRNERIAISNSKRKKPIGKEKLGDNHEGRGLITSGTSFPRREWPLNRREGSSVTDTRIVEIRGNVRCYWLDLYCS